MAAISGVTEIIDSIDFTDDWESVELDTGLHTAYLIAIKGDKSDTDVCDLDAVVAVTLEIGIESGVTNQYLTILRPTLYFNQFTSSNEEMNKKSAFVRLDNLPTEFYIKVLGVQTFDKSYHSGTLDISFNVNPVNVGDY